MPSPLKASWKRLLSFRKSDWEPEDYPIEVRAQAPDPKSPYEDNLRFKTHLWRALVVNWPTMDGTGDTREKALDDLRANFLKRKTLLAEEGKSLPRPGTKVPIQFAARVRVNAHPELAQDFVHRVLGLPWAFISDESCFWHFHAEENNDTLITKIREVYGVDVSHIESGNLGEILDRIAASRPQT